MGADYPADLIAREPAPPYDGEGAFALWHFSEDGSLGRFWPRPRAGDPGGRALVWAVDTRHAPLFWFPRDCPFWRRVADSTVGYSGSRLRNAAPHADQFT